MNDKLRAPQSFRDASIEAKKLASNGCGPQWAAFDVVPDNLFGLNIGCACDIHDWMYDKGLTLADKAEADAWFYDNMKRIVDEKGGALRWPRRLLARWYYRTVCLLGSSSFSGGDNV